MQSGWRQPTRPRDGGTNPIVLADASATAESGAKSKVRSAPQNRAKKRQKKHPEKGVLPYLEFSENYHELALQDDFEDASKARMKVEMAKVKKLLRKVMKWINDIDDEDERLSSEVVFCPNRFNGEEMIVIYNAFHHEIWMLTNFRDHYEKHFDVDDAETFCRKMIKKVKMYLDIAGINLVPIPAK